MLCSACVVPSAPLLLPDLAPDDAELTALRRTCVDAVRMMIGTGPERIVVVGGQNTTVPVAEYGVAVDGLPRQALGSALGTWLSTDAGWTGPPPHLIEAGTASIDTDIASIDAGAGSDAYEWTPTGDVSVMGHNEPMGMIVLADLSAAVGDASPRRRSDAAAVLSASIADAVAEADTEALLAIDQEKARTLAIEGAAALRTLASATTRLDIEATLLFRGAPFGVDYVVALWRRRTGSR